MKEIRILWADDEIDLLKPYILFLEEKGYTVSTAYDGEEALELVRKESFNLIFLDENMPGLSGLETLDKIKDISPSVPVVMITKSEEENIMDEAIGSKIADYLIKPVNPKQILLTIKKNIDNRRLVSEKTTSAYQVQFSQIGTLINAAYTFDNWVEIYKKLVFWEHELENLDESEMNEVLAMQWSDANSGFTRFVKLNYQDWFKDNAGERPVMSPHIFSKFVFPNLEKSKTVVILIDNLRYDQWKLIEQQINTYFNIDEEHIFCSILPTATQYARNAMFAGLMPAEIKKLSPEYWLDDEDEGGKNMHEEGLCRLQLQRQGISSSFHYEKISNQKHGKKVVENFSDLINYDLNILVYNFVDMLSHARTEMDVIKELAYDDRSYRSLTLSWFNNSYLLDLIRLISENNMKLVLTTDHGAVRVNNPVKVIGDRKTSSNLRYKQGKNLNYQAREVFEITDPGAVHLPKSHVSTSYIFAGSNDFMVYPNNYNHFVNHFRNTFQHGGISLEEMLIPCVVMSPIS